MPSAAVTLLQLNPKLTRCRRWGMRRYAPIASTCASPRPGVRLAPISGKGPRVPDETPDLDPILPAGVPTTWREESRCHGTMFPLRRRRPPVRGRSLQQEVVGLRPRGARRAALPFLPAHFDPTRRSEALSVERAAPQARPVRRTGFPPQLRGESLRPGARPASHGDVSAPKPGSRCRPSSIALVSMTTWLCNRATAHLQKEIA